MQSSIAFTRQPVAHSMDCLHGPVLVVKRMPQENTLCIGMVHFMPRLLWLRNLHCEHVLAVELQLPLLSNHSKFFPKLGMGGSVCANKHPVEQAHLTSGIHLYLHTGSLAAGLQEGC